MKINKKKTYLVQQTILIKIAKSSAPLIHSSVLNFNLGHFSPAISFQVWAHGRVTHETCL